MNVLSVLGSPRRNGNTAVLVQEYLKGILSHNKDNKIKEIFLQEKNIQCCRACDACKDPKNNICVIDDEMKDMYLLIEEADIIIFSTPVYWWSMSAQLKIFIDRIYGMGNKKRLMDKKVVLLMTYGGELPNNGPCLVENTFKEISNFLSMDFLYSYGVCTGNGISAKDNTDALKQVFKLGCKLESDIKI